MTEPPDLTALRALADAATPGPWQAQEEPNAVLYGNGMFVFYARVRNSSEEYPWIEGKSSEVVIKPEDAAYIAAANPEAITALLDEIERLRAKVARLSEPDIFWGRNYPDTDYCSAQDVLDDADPNEAIVEVHQARRLPPVFMTEAIINRELHVMEFPSREEAQAWLDAQTEEPE